MPPRCVITEASTCKGANFVFAFVGVAIKFSQAHRCRREPPPRGVITSGIDLQRVPNHFQPANAAKRSYQ
jgi:hypothetical protein